MNPPATRTDSSSLCFSALALLILLCTGCASVDPIPPPGFMQTHCSKTVLMLPNRLESCPAGTGGCAWEVEPHAWAIIYPSNSDSVREHEIEHVCGMNHREPWVAGGFLKTCAEVTEGGSTAWLPGQVMCRFAGGDIRLEENPSVIENVRRLHSQKTTPDAELNLNTVEHSAPAPHTQMQAPTPKVTTN